MRGCVFWDKLWRAGGALMLGFAFAVLPQAGNIGFAS